ncbi:MAG: hypothetical protein HFP77_09055 [Methylococcales symbiont of Iophon sp. n. MRB-2018]|nr:MAG: hypothetical protein HFP77_09055 [Methylococcales symbiont of Iophon sp. n. MRB-2018]KAF3979304.1 MAG: hypothetical protein HFP76_07615 [Methylococcales symbiont of Iophon sp. n. MRB-2018]
MLFYQILVDLSMVFVGFIIINQVVMVFLRVDYLAGMLAYAAKNKKPELVNFYFSEMNESCIS